MQVVFQSEINEFSRNVLQKHWPEVPLWGDINQIRASNIPEADLWCGGFPCQDLSLANQGKRLGLEGERSGLFYRFADLVSERRPRWVVLENVPGLLNSANGADFRAVISTLDQLGYGVSWRIFDAKYFGTPQRRRRVFLVASLGNLLSAGVLFEPGTNSLAAEPSLRPRQAATSGLGSGLPDSNTNADTTNADTYVIQHASIGRKHTAGPQAKGYRNDGEAYTLDSRGSSDAVCAPNAPYRIREVAGLSTQLDGHRYRAVGNAVAVPVIEWIGHRIMGIEAAVKRLHMQDYDSRVLATTS